MPTSVALTPYFEAFIREQIESGRYNNTSEVIRADLRALEEPEQQINLMLCKKRSTQVLTAAKAKMRKKYWVVCRKNIGGRLRVVKGNETGYIASGRTGYRGHR